MRNLLHSFDPYIVEAREVVLVLGAFVCFLGVVDLTLIDASKVTDLNQAWIHAASSMTIGSAILYRGAVAQASGC